MFDLNLEKAPAEGIILAYFPEKPVFEPYVIRGGQLIYDGCEEDRERNLLECHLFDRTKEYRTVFCESREERIESVLTAEEEDSMDPDLLYTEEQLVKDAYKKKGIPDRLKVVSRYRFSENDTLELCNYRLALPDCE